MVFLESHSCGNSFSNTCKRPSSWFLPPATHLELLSHYIVHNSELQLPILSFRHCPGDGILVETIRKAESALHVFCV